MTATVLAGILNYNSVDDCVATDQSFREQTYASFDLLVVDNSSTNDAAAEVAARCPGLAVERNAENGGFAGGMNSILERALERGYQYAALSNNDIALPPHALESLVMTARANPNAAVIGAVEVDWVTGEVCAVGGTEFNLILGRQRWVSDLPTDVITVAYAQGAFFLVPTEAVAKGLRLDDKLFMYYEEIDLGFRLRKMRRMAVVDPSVSVRHKSERRVLVPRNAYLQQRNRLYLVRRYGTTLHLAAHVVYVALCELPLKVIVRTAQGEWRFARACVSGFIDGLLGRMGRGRVSTFQ